jgi:TP901-1 family phage major tail protein
MTEYAGKAFLLKTGTWSGGTEVAGFRANTMTINNAMVDTSSKASSWRTAIAGGIKSVTISGSGVVSDAAAFETFQGYALAAPASANALAMGWGDSDTMEGSFIVTSFELTGDYEGAQTFSFTAESVGTVTLTAA